MNKEEAIKCLKNYIETIYTDTNKQLKTNIYRGHSRSISTDIEDAIAIFISDILPEDEYKILSDPSIYINHKNHRPDLLVINKNNEVTLLIEIKANMGWCRDASNVLNDMIKNDSIFKREIQLKCEFSKKEAITVLYKNPKLLLVALTDGNCSKEKHLKNKDYAKSINIYQFNLFSGWYGNLSNNEISDFYDFIINNV